MSPSWQPRGARAADPAARSAHRTAARPRCGDGSRRGRAAREDPRHGARACTAAAPRRWPACSRSTASSSGPVSEQDALQRSRQSRDQGAQQAPQRDPQAQRRLLVGAAAAARASSRERRPQARRRSWARSPARRSGSRTRASLLLLDLWRDLDPKPIGVIRNPVAVRKSLERRARERGERHPQLSAAGMGGALGDLQPGPPGGAAIDGRFPVIDFDRHADLDAQVRAALAFHGVEAASRVAVLRPRAGRPARRRLALAGRSPARRSSSGTSSPRSLVG